jgi:two-component system, NarL family, response regulator YdfI
VSLERSTVKVIVQAGSAVSQAGLESLLKLAEGIDVVEISLPTTPSRDWISLFEIDAADVLLVEGKVEHSILQYLGELAIDDPMPAIVVLTRATQQRELASLFASGVRGLLPYSASPQEIVAAMRAAAAGLSVIHPDFQHNLFDDRLEFRPDSNEPVLEPLTPREQEVLALLSQGFSNKAIAAQLHLSEHTIKFHIGAIFEKLNASSRTEAVAIGIRQGLIML